MRAGWIVPMVAMAALLATAGCGYRSDTLFRPNVRTIYVDMFTSKEFRRDLEFSLTEAVKKRISMETPYRLAPRDKADTILKGEVVEQRQSAFGPDPLSRLPREKQLTLAIRVTWKDQRSGQILVDQPVLLQAVDYLPPAGESEKFAQSKAIDRLAQRIIARLYEDW